MSTACRRFALNTVSAAIVALACLSISCDRAPAQEPHPPATEPLPDITILTTSFTNGPASTLSATIYLPAADAEAVAGIVILGGSERGPQTDMKRRLAAHFAQNNIAALIYDSPGTGTSTGNTLMQTREDRAIEALAAVICLRKQKQVPADRVGLMGISEGALVTILAAGADLNTDVPRPAFIIPVSASTGVPMLECARYRIETKGLARGLDTNAIQKALLLEELLFALLAGNDAFDWPLIIQKANQWPNENWVQMAELVQQIWSRSDLDLTAQAWDDIKQELSIWRTESWFDLVVVDVDRFDRLMTIPTGQMIVLLFQGPLSGYRTTLKVAQESDAIARITCPILAVWGENDEFLPPRRSESFFRARLAETGHAEATYYIIPNASHTLTTKDGGDEFVNNYPDLLSDWILQYSHQKAP
ncbi:MAG: alpha/beta hydrolase [Planctomycetes bacterium]|nr:alpha/beta hydrolase [Planctomycetota bacterium]NOG55396.1 alpha/beta hydrolase [Planctomycetota bacterium]